VTFFITILHDRQSYRLLVEKLPSDKAFDYYRVSGNNKSIVFKNNQPVLNRYNLKHRKPQWKVHEGDVWNASFKEALVKKIEEELKY